MSQTTRPGWAYLLAGILIGLFIAFLVYLRTLPPPSSIPAPMNNAAVSEPIFEFYKILPEMEVVIPDTQLQPERKKTTTTEQKTTVTEPERNQYFEPKGDLYLQVGSFQEYAQADKMKASLALVGIEAKIQKIKVDDKNWHRVRVGPFSDVGQLNAAKQQLQQQQIPSITLQIRDPDV